MATLDLGEKIPVKRAWFSLVAVVLLAGSLAAPAVAQSGPTPEELRLRVERWRTLTPDERQKFVERYRAFKTLPPEQQLQLQQSFQRWKNMDQVTRQRLLNRWRHYQSLSPDKKREFHRRWRKWQAMKADDRARLKQKFRKFQALTPDERRAIIERYKQEIQPPEVRPFREPGAPHRPLMPRPRDNR